MTLIACISLCIKHLNLVLQSWQPTQLKQLWSYINIIDSAHVDSDFEITDVVSCIYTCT